MTDNLLANGGFEAEFDPNAPGAHRCFVITQTGTEWREVGNIFNPPGWTVYFVHDSTYAQPEGRDARATDPPRMRTGKKGYVLFTFSRRHDCGLMQTVNVRKGSRVQFSVWAHAWSNHKDISQPDVFPHPDDPKWSEGAGYEKVAWPWELDITGSAQDDAKLNFRFDVGIDPTGGADPDATSVNWSEPWSIYNGYVKQLTIEAVAQSDKVTVFVGSRTLWPFKHNDAYFDDAELVIIEELPEPEPECRGLPREQYARTYHVIPATTPVDEATAIFKAIWTAGPATVGPSYDDAGIGDLDDKTAKLHLVPEIVHDEYEGWFNKWYPGTKVGFLNIPIPEPPPPPPPEPRTKACFHLQRPFDGALEMLRRLDSAGKPMAWVKIVAENVQYIQQVKAVSPKTKVLFRCIPQEQPAYFTGAKDYAKALDNSSFAPKFDEAVELGFDAIETPVNELIGTNTYDGTIACVNFDWAYCYWAVARSGGRVRPAILNPGGGNPDHGIEETWLIPAVRAAIDTNALLVPHTYFPVTPAANVSEAWMKSAQVQYDYHLRPVLSWLKTFKAAGIDVSKLRFLFGECGACGAHNVNGEPGGYKDAGAGWRRSDALAGNLDRYVKLLAWYEGLCQEWDQIEGWTIFTSGFVGWEHFQFNKEWGSLVDALLGSQ